MGRASRWEHSLSVAQHSLTVFTIREADGALTPGEALRELLHDATEFMLGWDCITPLKAQLGEPFRALEAKGSVAAAGPELTREPRLSTRRRAIRYHALSNAISQIERAACRKLR